MPQCSDFDTSVIRFIEQHDGGASVFNKSSVLGVNLNERVGKHPAQLRVHLATSTCNIRVKKRPPPTMSIIVTDMPSQAAMVAMARAEVVDAVGEDRQNIRRVPYLPDLHQPRASP